MLRQCEERLKSVLALSADWYWEQDEKLRFTRFSGKTFAAAGFEPDSLIGKTRWEVPGAQVDPAERAAVQAKMDAREPFVDHEYKRVSSDGTVRYVRASGQPAFDEKNRFCGYRGIARDVTESKREDALQSLEHAVAHRIADAETVTAAMSAVIRAICETEGWECGRYFRADNDAGVLRFGESWGVQDPAIQEFIERSREIVFKPGVGLMGRAWQSGQPLWVADVTRDSRALRAAFTADLGIRGGFVFPVRLERKVIGVLAFNSRQVRETDDRLLKAILVIGSQIGQFLERKRAEEEQRRFRAAMDASADLMLLIDRSSMRYIDVNDAACRALGYSREELLALRPQDIFSKSREELVQLYDRMFAGELIAPTVEGVYRCKDGSQLPIEDYPRAVRSSAGDIIVSVARDVRERKRAEQLLMLEHTVARCITEAGSGGAALKAVIRAVCETEGWECGRYLRVDDAAGVLRLSESWGVASPGIEHFLAGSREISYAPGVGLAGSVWQSGEPLWVSDISNDARIMQKSIAHEIGLHGAVFFPVASEGKTIGVLAFNSREIRKPEERLLQAVRVIGSQIGQFLQRKRAEEDLQRFRIAMDKSADMIVLIDRATMRFVDVNETVCKLLGYSREELLQMGPQDVLPLSRTELERIYDEFIANPSQTHGMHSHYRRKDGSTFPFESTRHVLHSSDGYLIAAINRDISARVAAEEALRESEERFRGLTALSSDMFWEQDDQYRFTSFSGVGAGKLTQARVESIVGSKRWEQEYLNMTADDWARHIAILDARKPFRDLELCRLDASGNKVWFSVSGEPVFDSSGAFKGYRGVGKDITERKQDEERIQHLASHDTLTSLPNRAMFAEMLNLAIENARRYHRNFAVLFIDLDRFKVINDTLGHDAGDKLLQEMGVRLKQAVRSSDVVARLGGDEFVVLVQEVSEPKQVATVARKILSALVKPMFMQGQECRVTGSIGICMYPADAQDEQSLMKNADIAMYRAKEDGKNNYKFYSEETNVHSFERLAMETSLRKGLDRHEFFLHYQAKLDLHTGTITGVEALVRWQHPELGTVPPGQFIPLAEETGLIVPLGKWVLNAACAQNVAWQGQGLPPLRMSVNISARQFADESLLDDIAAALKESGMKPDLLELELTENMVMQNAERAGKMLAAIKRIGVRLAIDDFGVGYSSLTHLKRFPIDTLKVDRSFIRDIPQDAEDKAITEAIIAMGKSLNLTVVAEGVETLEQQTFLHDHDCDEMQGFFFSKPIDSDQFAELLRRRLDAAKK